MSELERPGPDDWIIIPNWERFQHYKDRDPAWIKVYTRLLSDPKYLGLSLAARGLLHGLWLAYALANGQLTFSQAALTCRGKFGYPQLEALNHAGFLKWSASKPLAPKKEKEVEKESFKSPYADKTVMDSAYNLALEWKSGTTEEFNERLDTLEQATGVKLRNSQREELWDIAWKRERRTLERQIAKPL